MANMKPITPDDVAAHKTAHIPNEVIEAFNYLIAKHWHDGRAVVSRRDVLTEYVNLVCHVNSHDAAPWLREHTVAAGYLNIEAIYEAAGWRVAYEKPDYNGPGDATYTFTRARKRREPIGRYYQPKSGPGNPSPPPRKP